MRYCAIHDSLLNIRFIIHDHVSSAELFLTERSLDFQVGIPGVSLICAMHSIILAQLEALFEVDMLCMLPC